MTIRTFAAAVAVATLAGAGSAQAKGTLYVGGAKQVGAHAIAADGTLTAIGTAAEAGEIGAARGVAVTPDGKHVYVAGAVGAVGGFNAAANGSLTPAPGAPYTTTGTFARSLAVSPDGKFIYVGQQNGGNGIISVFSIAADGKLTSVADLTGLATDADRGLAINPNGKFLYAANVPAGKVSTYAIAADGKLTTIGTPANGANDGLAVTPDGRFAYATDNATETIMPYAIGPDGTLTAGSAVPAGGTNPATIAIAPDGKSLYVADFGEGPVFGEQTGKISGFAIGADGKLTALAGSPFTATAQTYGVDVAPNGLVYGAGFDPVALSKVNAYRTTGATLTQLNNSPFTSLVKGAEFQSIAATPNQGPTVGAVTVSTAGPTATLTATGAADTDGGSVARYDWDFGDGTSKADGGATQTHTYAASGTYNVTVKVTDDEGCSDAVIFTGQTADCVGTAAAKTTVPATVVLPPPTGSPGVLDNTLNTKLGGKTKQKVGTTLSVDVSCDVACAAVVGGKLTVVTPAVKRGKKVLKKKRTQTFTLATVKQQIATKATIKLKLPLKARVAALAALRKRGTASVKVTVNTTSGLAKLTKTRTIKLSAPAVKKKRS